MSWLLLLLAIAAFAGAFMTSSTTVAVICLLVSLGLLVAWVMGLLAERVGSRSRDETTMLDPQELQRLRQLAEARRATDAAPPSEPPV